MRRRWITYLAVFLAIVVVTVATAPWWIGALLRAVGPHYGASFGRYERIGYARFALHDIVIHRPGVEVHAQRVESDTPLLWGWRHLRRTESPVTVAAWSVQVEKRPPTEPSHPSGWMPLRATLLRIDVALHRWLPIATTGEGVVRWPTGEISLKAARWRNEELTVDGLHFRSISADGVVAFRRGEDVITINATDKTDGAVVALESRGADVTGKVGWWEQTTTLAGRFADQGWMPAKAEIAANAIRLSADRLKLGTAYHEVVGTIKAAWDKGAITADAKLHAEPISAKHAPPIDVACNVHGDAQSVTIEHLHAVIPGGVADLSSPVTIDRSGALHESAARFSVHFDLAQQPWARAGGQVAGDARVVTNPGHAPAVDYTLSAQDLSLPGVVVQSARLQGRLTWPLLNVAELRVTGAGGEALTLHGGWNFRDKTVIDAVVNGAVSPRTVARFLPPGLSFESAKIDARASGPLTQLSHEGRLSVSNVTMAKLRPASGEVAWNGRGPNLSSFNANATIGDARIHAQGATTTSEVRLSEFTFAPAGAAALQLKEPTRLRWRPERAVDGLHLAGPDASIDVALAWGEAGRVELAVHGFSSRWLASVLTQRGPEWRVPSFALQGSWDHSPMTYSAAGELALALPENRSATINVSLKGGVDGLVVDALHAVESGNPVVNASGRLPVVLEPGRTPLVGIKPGGALVLDATTVPNAPFWQQLAAMTGVELRDPQVNAHVTGTWERPRGTVAFRVEHASMDPKRFARPLPTVDTVDVAVSGDPDGLTLNRFSFAIEGQLVRASGRLPVDRDTWSKLMHDPMPYLQEHSELRVEVPDAQVAMFSRFLPAALAPAGRFQADIHFEQGALGGYLRLHDAASRPLGPLGVLQQVNADVNFSDHRVVLQKVTATSGGQPITLTGSVELPSAGWKTGEFSEPKYDVALRGQNLPFVRQSGLLLRGDVDLKLQTPSKGPPGISGKVVLRDSLFLTDVRSFLPHGGGASPSRRPPYFSVETRPLNTWTLDIDVSGARFMRMRTPVFTGVASARFHLGGTLGEPRAIGDATIDEGTVRMPFAAFQVQQGAVRLTEENPFEPTIYLRGTGRHYGYDLTMEIKGKASGPNITFTSSPALDAEQVLLMVMTGAAPSNEVNASLSHRAVQIGAFFGQSLVSSLTGGGVEPDRLSIESGEKISQQGKETYSIEYKLNDRWSVTGEYDEFDEYNAGFKWRVAPRKKDHEKR